MDLVCSIIFFIQQISSFPDFLQDIFWADIVGFFFIKFNTNTHAYSIRCVIPAPQTVGGLFGQAETQ